jgi:urease accessory protein
LSRSAKKTNMRPKVSLFLLLSVLPSIAEAHEVGAGGSFVSGLGHPVLGLDHFFAMVAVGVLSSQIGGRAIWTIPSEFVGVMLVGGLLGMGGVRIFSVEFGIALSVLVLGLAIAVGRPCSTAWSVVSVGVFALFHGNAHGLEMPHLATPWLYASGFLVGTASIHILGVLIGLAVLKLPDGTQFMRYIGAGVAGVGFHILLSL